MAKEQQRNPEREAFWRGVVARFGKSDLTVRGFCARERVSEDTFYFWRREIQRRDAERPGSSFVPIVVSNTQSAESDHSIVIELRGGRAMRLPAALPIGQIAELVHAIEAAPEAQA